MFKADTDIKKIKKDKLNRANFAKSLASNIENYFKKSINNCLTIGLMGEWGSGKTTILNMTEQYLNNSKIKIIKFNPWLYSSYNQLVEQFFDELIMEFTDSRDKSLSGLLRQYKIKVNKLELVKKLSIAGTSIINPKLAGAVENILDSSSEEENLAYLKKKIDEQFYGRKVVCIIDDLDRLSRDEIAAMFKLIKIMADFKNMIYLISFDKDVVSKALKEDYGGEKYIEKIINVPLQVPSIDYNELRKFLVNHFKRISSEYNKNLDFSRLNQFLDFQPDQYGKKCGILYFFTNMRDITRFINILEFNLELIIDEINLVDFIVITAIQVFHSEIYDKIKLNEFLLINYHYTAIDELQRRILEIEKAEFEELVNNNDNVNHILRVLFPKMGNIYKNRPSFKFKNKEYADKNLLIQHPNHFKAYFKLNSIIKELSESETDFIVNFINSKDDYAVKMQFTRLYKENKLRLFFENIKNRLDKIHKNKFFLNFLFNIETLMWEDIFFLNKDEIEELCLEMIYHIGKQDRYIVLKEIYQNSNNVILLYDILDTIKVKKHLPYNYDEFILEDEEIKDLNEITKEQFNKLPNKRFINHLKEILYLSRKLNLESKNKSIIDYFTSTSDRLLTLLTAFLPQNENSKFLLMNMKELNEFKNVDEIKQLIDNYDSIKNKSIVKIFLEGYAELKSKCS